MATIVAQQNQSMPDVIVQCMGTLEGGMCFCALNGVAISDVPVVGAVYQVPDGSQQALIAFDSSMVDTGVLKYLQDRGSVKGGVAVPYVIGNLGAAYEAPVLWDGGGGVQWDGDGGAAVEWDR